MAPGPLRRAMGHDRDTLLLCLSDGKLEVRQRGTTDDRLLSSIPWGDRERTEPTAPLRGLLSGFDGEDYNVVLMLDRGLTLDRALIVPRAAGAEIRGVLAFEIERHTPFREHEVYFHHAIDHGAGQDTNMTVDLVIVPRRMVDPVIRGLRELAFGLDRVEVTAAPDDEAVAIPIEGIGERRRRGNYSFRVMGLLVLALAFVAAASPLLRMKLATEDLAVFVEQARLEAETSLALQREIDELTLGMNVIVRAKASSSSPLAVLQALSGLFPDGTWVVQLSVVGDEVTLEGRTDSSTRLVGLLEASPLFESVKYLAPITRDAAGEFERFNFSLRLERG